MALFRLLLIFLVIYLAFHLIIKPLLRIFLQQAVRKVVEKEFDQFRDRGPKRAEGSIHVDYIPGKNSDKSSKNNNDEGEYVDFEEVK